MRIMNRDKAQKLIDNSQYLKGHEVKARFFSKTLGKKVKAKCVVESFGAFSWRPRDPKSDIQVYAVLRDPQTGEECKVMLEKLHKSYPPSRFRTMEKNGDFAEQDHLLEIPEK